MAVNIGSSLHKILEEKISLKFQPKTVFLEDGILKTNNMPLLVRQRKMRHCTTTRLFQLLYKTLDWNPRIQVNDNETQIGSNQI